MTTSTMNQFMDIASIKVLKKKRVESIDLLRGIIMIIMALDHVRDYFHRDAFLYDPADLSQSSVWLFFTRFITHYCAPVFVFLAGTSAYLNGARKKRGELEFYLFTRGLWLVFVELFIISLIHTFNPQYPIFNLQVIWAIGISMIVLSVMIYLKRQYILLISLLLIAGHNFFDSAHVPDYGATALFWSFLHEPRIFVFGQFTVFIHYPIIPWIGIMGLGYYFGAFYNSMYDDIKRRKILLYAGSAAIVLFFLLRIPNIYGDKSVWSMQKSNLYNFLSILNVTKYPPSLLYTFITLGPAMIFLAISEKPLNSVKEKLVVFGRVPFFYYIVHLFLIHLFALIGAMMTGYSWRAMILTGRINHTEALKGYGFTLPVVYTVWIALVLILYPLCKWFGQYKKLHQFDKKWLSYF